MVPALGMDSAGKSYLASERSIACSVDLERLLTVLHLM